MRKLTVSCIEPQDIVDYLKKHRRAWKEDRDGAVRRVKDRCCPIEAYFDLGAGTVNDAEPIYQNGRLMVGSVVNLLMDASDNLPTRLPTPVEQQLAVQMREALRPATKARKRG
jgi:hypothetical protein